MVPAPETLEGQFGLVIIATLSARVSEKSPQRVPSGAQDFGGGSLVRLRGRPSATVSPSHATDIQYR